MKKKCKIRLALILFAIAAFLSAFFVLSYDPPEKITINYDNGDRGKIIKNSPQGDKPSGDSIKKENTETIDRQATVEKWKGEDISRIKTDKKFIALTFDGGANADGAGKILSILKDNGIKGTFFLTGKFIEKYPGETAMIFASGGNVGNHSYSHPYFTKLTGEEINTELEKTENALLKLNLEFHPFFRFPYGDRNRETIYAINGKNYISIRWTVDSLGWEGTSGGMTKESVESRVLSKAAAGAIVLMHLGTNPDDKTQLDSEALPGIISALKTQGYEFMTMTEMLNYK
ncbi:MAG: polysaccharide deacetylase family protein [Candidatus Paceibacterota bacterium]|jgi:peptidoglycan/xylan/chitin deacetylase (PgdA/CDA1 family)